MQDTPMSTVTVFKKALPPQLKKEQIRLREEMQLLEGIQNFRNYTVSQK